MIKVENRKEQTMEEQIAGIIAVALNIITIVGVSIYNKLKQKYYKTGNFYVKCAKCGNKIYLKDAQIEEDEANEN